MKTPGIYILTNTKNSKQYVGQSYDIARRIADHLSGRNSNIYLQRALKKYGCEVFNIFTIPMSGISEETLNQMEVSFIRLLKTLHPLGYNLTTGGKNGKRTDETKRKISEAHRGKKHSKEHRQKILAAHKGSKRGPLSEAHRRKISEAHRGKKRGPLSEAHRRKISEAHRDKKGKKRGPLSEAHRRKISEAKRGEKHHFYGKPLSDETKLKISASKRGKPPPWKGKKRGPYKKRHSPNQLTFLY